MNIFFTLKERYVYGVSEYALFIHFNTDSQMQNISVWTHRPEENEIDQITQIVMLSLKGYERYQPKTDLTFDLNVKDTI